MALNMGQLRRLLAQNGFSDSTEAAAAQLVADSLLRGVGRQAIIAAAADAVAQLGGGGYANLPARTAHQLLASLPGGPIDDGETKDGGDGDQDAGKKGTGPS